MRRLLYLLTGVVTAIPVLFLLSWAVWGAPVSVTEYISLLGSLLLVVAAAIGKENRRAAGRLALLGTAGIWSLCVPAIVGLVREHLADQELSLTVLRWTPSPSPLEIQESRSTPGFPDPNPSPTEVQQIKNTGITGTLSVYTANGRYGHGKKSHVILIMQGPVSKAIALREPDASNVIYVQDSETWRMFPPNAPTLARTIWIETEWDDPKQCTVMVELSNGARQGFGVWWPKTGWEPAIK